MYVQRFGAHQLSRREDQFHGMEYVCALGLLLYELLTTSSLDKLYLHVLQILGDDRNLGRTLNVLKTLGTVADKYPQICYMQFGVEGWRVKSLEVAVGFLNGFEEWGIDEREKIVNSISPAPMTSGLGQNWESILANRMSKVLRYAGKRVVGSFQNWVLDFENWATAGASSSVKLEYENKRLRVSRRTASGIENIDQRDQEQILTIAAQLYALAVKRNDAASNRIINGGTDAMFIKQSWLEYYFEGSGSDIFESTVEESVAGALARVAIVRRLIASGSLFMPLDYAGFYTCVTT